MKRERWDWKHESWPWTLFSIVLVTLAVPLGIWLFDHPLIVLLPLSAARLRSKNMDDDPAERREPGGRPGPGDPRAGASLFARPAAKLLPVVALLVFAAPAFAADPCAGLADVAAAVAPAEVDDGSWPFEDLTPPLQQAIRSTVADADPVAACNALERRFDGDRKAAASVLGVALAVLADPFPDGCREAVSPWGSEELLAVIERHPRATDWSPAVALFFLERRRDCPAPTAALLETLGGLGTAGSERALELIGWWDKWVEGYAELLALAAREPRLRGRVALRVAENEYGPVRAVAFEVAHAARATLPDAATETLDRHRLAALLDAGLGNRALATWDALPAERRRGLLAEPWGDDEYGEPEDRRLDLVAAALLAGRPDDAAAWFAAVPPRPEADERPGFDTDPRPAIGYALARAGAGEVTSDADPFDLFSSLLVGGFGDDLWGRDTLLRLLVRLAEQERFEAIADHLASMLARSVDNLGFEEAVFPAAMSDARALRRQWLGELTRALPTRADLAVDEPLAPREARNPSFEARPLADLDTSLPLHPSAAADGVTPPAGFAPVRVERNGDQVIVLALSQALDPVGEVSQGGYWVLRSHDRGANWQALYTGLRVFTPYEAVGTSRLPLAAPRGVRVEVRRAELDETAIFFPPIGLTPERGDEALYLDLPWADLERDSDGDGLTDLYEERLLTDPRSADSDGDGLDDGLDPLPGVAYAPDGGAHAAAFAAFLASISNADARAILPNCPDGSDALCFGRPALGGERTHFAIGDAASWSALAPAERTVVMSQAEHREAEARWGPIFATEVVLFQLDHTGERAVFIWTRRWTGGSGLAVRGPAGEWTATGTFWIT